MNLAGAILKALLAANFLFLLLNACMSNHFLILTKRFYDRVTPPKDADRITSSLDPHQTTVNCLSLEEPVETSELRHEKTGLRGFQPGPTQTRLYSHRRLQEACNFGFRKKRDCTNYVTKTKALISCAATAQLVCAATAQLVCAFIFALCKSWFSNDMAQVSLYRRFHMSIEVRNVTLGSDVNKPAQLHILMT